MILFMFFWGSSASSSKWGLRVKGPEGFRRKTLNLNPKLCQDLGLRFRVRNGVSWLASMAMGFGCIQREVKFQGFGFRSFERVLLQFA